MYSCAVAILKKKILSLLKENLSCNKTTRPGNSIKCINIFTRKSSYVLQEFLYLAKTHRQEHNIN